MLAAGASYSRTETMFAPPSLTGRFTVFVIADSAGVVFENGSESNDAGAAGAPLDLMPIPYADLRLVDLAVPTAADSGTPLAVTWTVRNDGIGRTNTTGWSDVVTIARNADGSGVVTSAAFDHLGILEPGGSYVRTASVQLPNALQKKIGVVFRLQGVLRGIAEQLSR